MPRWANVAIGLLLAWQIFAPVHYYACNEDPRDERFAWRMFSPIRMQRCGTQFVDANTDKIIKVQKHFHSAWLQLAARGRQQVIAAMGRHLCEVQPELDLRIRIQCEREAHTVPTQELHNRARDESDDKIEVVSRGAFNFCTTDYL